MNFNSLSVVTLFAILLSVKASEEVEGIESCTGIFDSVDGPITLDTISTLKPSKNANNLVYGMKAKPSAEIIKDVITQGLADVNAFDGYGRCALSYALDNDDYEAADALIASGADVNTFNFSTIMVIIAQADYSEEQKMRAIKYLLDHDADPKATGNSGFYALSSAAYKGNVELVRLFLDLGLDVNHSDNYGQTPLIRAAESSWSNVETVQLLLANGAEMGTKDKRGENAVFKAAFRAAISRNYDILECLLQNGGVALLHEINNKGETVEQAIKDVDSYGFKMAKLNEIIAKYQ